MSDKKYTKYSLALIGALTKLILDRTPLGRGEQAIEQKYRVKDNKKKVNTRTIKSFLNRPSVRRVVESKLNEGKTPEQAAVEFESSTLGQDVFQSVFTPRAYLTGAQRVPQDIAVPQPEPVTQPETKAEERDREAREAKAVQAKEGVESKAEPDVEPDFDRDTKIITDAIIDMKEEQPTLGDAIAPRSSRSASRPRAALTNEERKIMAELVDQITQQRDNLITVSAMWLDVPVREVALDVALLGIVSWIRNIGLIDADDSKIIEGTSATSKAISDLLSKLYGMSIKSLVREAEKRKRDLLEAINDEPFSQEEKKILGGGIEEDIDQILAAVMRESSTDVDLYERTVGRQLDRGVDKKRIRAARRRFIKAAVVQSRWNSLIKMRGAKKFEKTIAGKLITLSSAAKSLYNKLEAVSVKKIAKPAIVAALAAVAERMGIRNVGQPPASQQPQPQPQPQQQQQQQLPQPPISIPAPSTAPAIAPQQTVNIRPTGSAIVASAVNKMSKQLAIRPVPPLIEEQTIVPPQPQQQDVNVFASSSKTGTVPIEQAMVGVEKGTLRPEFIIPSAEVFEATPSRQTQSALDFAKFDYVKPYSIGGLNDDNKNPLSKRIEFEEHIRYLGWQQLTAIAEREASRYLEKQKRNEAMLPRTTYPESSNIKPYRVNPLAQYESPYRFFSDAVNIDSLATLSIYQM
jgi:hypothetical protein